MAQRILKNTGIIALHLNETELVSIDRIARYHRVSRSAVVQTAIQNCPLKAIFSTHLENRLKTKLQTLKEAACQQDLTKSKQLCDDLLTVPQEILRRLNCYQQPEYLKFKPRKHDGITKTTSVRLTPEAIEFLHDICWISGLTITDTVIRLVTRRHIPDRQITKIRLLFQHAIKTLRYITSENSAIGEIAQACTTEFEYSYRRFNHDC